MAGYNKRLKFLFTTFGVFLLYCLGFLTFGETHPFSRFPMYSSFPNWSYVFYITDEEDHIIPFEDINIHGAEVSHLYYLLCEDLGIRSGDFEESNKELEILGSKMLAILKEQQQFNYDTLKLYRKGYYLENDSIISLTELMIIKTYD